MLRDLVNATIGFEGLADAMSKPSKSLHRMLSASRQSEHGELLRHRQRPAKEDQGPVAGHDRMNLLGWWITSQRPFSPKRSSAQSLILALRAPICGLPTASPLALEVP
jgi:hypothetical protein